VFAIAETPMNQTKFPEGRDEERVRRVLAHYEEQAEDEALAEDEAGIESSETVTNAPRAKGSGAAREIARLANGGGTAG